MDKIKITNLEVLAKHGVLPAEKMYRQKFLVTVVLYLDLREAGKSDDLGKTIDYDKTTIEIKEFIENNTFDLIETVAGRLADKLLIENPMLQKVKIEISKPEARINADFETVSVEITRCRYKVFLSLGSNMGDREANLKFAIEELNNIPENSVLKVSEFYNTAPYGSINQDDFLNACIEVDTILSPNKLLETIQAIEAKAGRERIEKWGPRTLDIDIIYYGDLILSINDLIIPHLDMHNREFVLLSLKEIAPNRLHPIYKKTTIKLLEEITTRDEK